VAICVTGMHRSGTSMIVRLLHECGVYLGNDFDLVPPSPDNEEGHWENRHFLDLNDRILAALGGGWDYPPLMAEGWPGRSELAACRDDAAQLIARFDPHAPWAWKDPRNSLTVPFWASLIQDLRVIVCLRNPLEVAESLRRRSYNSYQFGLNLWLEYNRRVLADTLPNDRVVTHYDAYFVEPRRELERVLGLLGILVPASTIDRACETVAGRLRHNRREEDDLTSTLVPESVQLLYHQMGEEAGVVTADLLAMRPAQFVPVVTRPSSPEDEASQSNAPQSSDSVVDSKWLDHLHSYTATLSYRVNDLTQQRDSLCQALDATEASRQDLEEDQVRLARHLEDVDGQTASLRLAVEVAEAARQQLEEDQDRLARHLEEADRRLLGERETVLHLAGLSEKFRRLSALLVSGRDHPIQHILVVKTSSAHYCRMTLDQVGSLFPGAQLILWTEERESKEFFLRPEIERVILYRNLLAIPRMVRDLKAARANLVVIQSTSETAYFKMLVFAAAFGSQPWIIFDHRGEVRSAGGLHTRLETITRSFFESVTQILGDANPILVLILGTFRVGRLLTRVIAAPFVALGLLIGAARHSFDRYRYLRQRSRFAAKVQSDD
jgi:hypothetical protein